MVLNGKVKVYKRNKKVGGFEGNESIWEISRLSLCLLLVFDFSLYFLEQVGFLLGLFIF